MKNQKKNTLQILESYQNFTIAAVTFEVGLRFKLKFYYVKLVVSGLLIPFIVVPSMFGLTVSSIIFKNLCFYHGHVFNCF